MVEDLICILLRRAQLCAQIGKRRLSGLDDLGAGLLSLIDLLLLGGDLGVGVVEVQVEVEGVYPEPDDAGGQEAGDGDPAPRPLAMRRWHRFARRGRNAAGHRRWGGWHVAGWLCGGRAV